jgi:phosphatidate cytidylyltransferase
MAASNLVQRVAVAAVGIPVAVVAIYLGGWVLGVLLAAFAALGALELYRLAAAAGIRALELPGALAAAGFVLIAAARPSLAGAAPALWLLAVVLLLLTLLAAIWTRGVDGRPLGAAAVTVFGALYAGGTLAFALFLRHLLPDTAPAFAPLVPAGAGLGAARPGAMTGAALLFFPIALTWVNDSFAYFGGRRFGRRKLIPAVSPNKTVAGSVAGILGTVPVGALYAALVLEGWAGLPFGPVHGALCAALIAVLAQVGDLAESLLKREAGVKDSGALLPGHGGVLDRFDALYCTIPAGYLYLAAVLAGGSAAGLAVGG